MILYNDSLTIKNHTIELALNINFNLLKFIPRIPLPLIEYKISAINIMPGNALKPIEIFIY